MRLMFHWIALIVLIGAGFAVSALVIGAALWALWTALTHFSDWWWMPVCFIPYGCAKYIENHGMPWKPKKEDSSEADKRE